MYKYNARKMQCMQPKYHETVNRAPVWNRNGNARAQFLQLR